MNTPECNRMLAVADESHKLGDFLDWLTENDIHLAVWERTKVCDFGEGPIIGNLFDGRSSKKWRCVDGQVVAHPDSNKPGAEDGPCPKCEGTGRIERIEPRLIPHVEPFNRLLARYFGIDLDKVEEERRRVLEELRGTR
jgi:hypothetical protein